MEDKKQLEERIKNITVEKSANLIPFEPGVSPYEEHNKEAARVRGLRYNPRIKHYVDSDGCPVLDRFGQPLG